MTLIKARSRGINLADTFNFTGTLQQNGGAIAGGKILQVQHTSDYNVSTSTTTSFASLVSVNITPNNASNKILLLGQIGEPDRCDGRLAVRFYKAGSWAGSSNSARILSELGRGLSNTGDETHRGNVSSMFMDTAGGTSEITYAIYYARTQSSGSVRVGNGAPQVITAMEIEV
tara:strand:+ start:47 stop:565 length:519 start_codon:yes stop_codon:yes gene_type:complete